MDPTPDWLETVLQKPVDELQVDLIGEFSSVVSRLHIISKTLPEKLILKQPRHNIDAARAGKRQGLPGRKRNRRQRQRSHVHDQETDQWIAVV